MTEQDSSPVVEQDNSEVVEQASAPAVTQEDSPVASQPSQDAVSPDPLAPDPLAPDPLTPDPVALDAAAQGVTENGAEAVLDDADVSASSTGTKTSPGTATSALEREGEVAADFLEQLLDIADLDGDIDVDVDGDRAAVAIVDSEEGRVSRRLVGTEGKVLEALQELTRLAVQTATGERSRLMLDVAGYRAERRAAVVAVAQDAIATVKSTNDKVAMDSMTAFERKVVHDQVLAAGLVSESDGVEPHRHVVILPA